MEISGETIRQVFPFVWQSVHPCRQNGHKTSTCYVWLNVLFLHMVRISIEHAFRTVKTSVIQVWLSQSFLIKHLHMMETVDASKYVQRQPLVTTRLANVTQLQDNVLLDGVMITTTHVRIFVQPPLGTVMVIARQTCVQFIVPWIYLQIVLQAPDSVWILALGRMTLLVMSQVPMTLMGILILADVLNIVTNLLNMQIGRHIYVRLDVQET